MRVLVVLAFRNAGKARASPLETLGDRFVRLIKGMFNDSLAVDTLEVVTRRANQLEEFLPPVPTAGVPPDMALVRKRLGALDGIDFIFIDGDDRLQAWSKSSTPLLHLLQLCALSHKCVLGCGCTVQLLSYLTMVGCSPVPLVNSGGGSTHLTAGGAQPSLRTSKTTASMMGCGGAGDGDSQRPKSSASGHTSTATSNRSASSSASAGPGALLERHTGDLFLYDAGRRVWNPVNNVGVHSSLGVPTAHEGRLNDGLNRSDGVGLCEVTTLARFHYLFKGVWPPTFPVSQANEWHCHIRPGHSLRLPTGDLELRVLANSKLGQQVLECGNMVALQFRPDPRHPNTLRLLSNFIDEKMRLLLGDAGAAKGASPPRRILLDASRDEPHRSDIIQVVLQSLLPPTSSPAGVASTSDLSRPHLPPEVIAERTRSASQQSIGPAGAGPQRTRSWSAGPRAGSALSEASTNGSHASVGSAPAAVRAAKGSNSYCLPPGTALAYLHASRGALERSAAEVHVHHHTRGLAEMHGMENVPIYVAKPPRTAGQPDSRPVSRQTGRTPSRASSASIRTTQPGLRPLSGTSVKSGKEGGDDADTKPLEPDLYLEAFDVEDPDTAANAPTPPPPPTRVVKIKAQRDKPFSNYQKYQAARKALERQSIHITSVGPYVSKLDQQAIDDQKSKIKSIHGTAFFPAGLTHHSMKEMAGFAAGGFALPDDLPATAHKFGSFYNSHAHNFRATAPKNNVYM